MSGWESEEPVWLVLLSATSQTRCWSSLPIPEQTSDPLLNLFYSYRTTPNQQKVFSIEETRTLSHLYQASTKVWLQPPKKTGWPQLQTPNQHCNSSVTWLTSCLVCCSHTGLCNVTEFIECQETPWSFCYSVYPQFILGPRYSGYEIFLSASSRVWCD